MRYFIDTEFIETDRKRPLELISLGIVAQDGRELYLESGEVDLANANDWVKQNVVSQLSGGAVALPFFKLREAIEHFIPPRQGLDCYEPPEFWGYFADYDWVLFCQIFGTMMTVPRGYPNICFDVMQLAHMLGIHKGQFPRQAEGTKHNALSDARWTRDVYNMLVASTLPLQRR